MSLEVSLTLFFFRIFDVLLLIFVNIDEEPLYAKASRDTRVALMANAQNAENNRSNFVVSKIGDFVNSVKNSVKKFPHKIFDRETQSRSLKFKSCSSCSGSF